MTSRRVQWAGTVLLAAGLTGCGTSSSAPPPATLAPPPTPPLLATAPPAAVTTPPATTPSPTAPVGTVPATLPAPSAEAAINNFSVALTRGDLSGAASYLSSSLRAQTASRGLKHKLGLPQTPTSYQYTITSAVATRAVAILTYQYSGGSVSDTATLVPTPSGWRISAVQPD